MGAKQLQYPAVARSRAGRGRQDCADRGAARRARGGFIPAGGAFPRGDASARKRQSGRNFEFFGAPVGLIFSLDRRLTAHSWLDCGLFIQNVMLAARARSLDTCPQVSFVRYQSVIARHLGLGEHDAVVCGMALGYADLSAPVNALDISREPVDRFATFLGLDAP